MTTQVILKKSSIAARVPAIGDLAFGELALNYQDGVLYYKKADGTTIGSFGGGNGTVTSVAALTIGSSGTDVTSTVADSTTTPVITLNIPTASASNRGVLSSTDWTTFNNKLATTNVVFIGTTSISLSRTTGSQTLTGVSIDGTAATSTTANSLNVSNSYVGTGFTVNSTGVIGLASSGDITLYRSGANTAAIYFTPSGNNRYLFYDGTDFRFSGGDLYVKNLKVSPITVKNRGTDLTTSLTSINFTGQNISSSTVGSDVTVTLGNRVATIIDGVSITINCDTTDTAFQTNTQATGTLSINAVTGTPVNGQKLILKIKSTNVQTFSWNAAFSGSTDSTLPSVTSGGNKYDYMGFIYSSDISKWQLIAKNFGF